MISRDNFFRTSDDAIIYFEDYSKDKDDVIVLIPGFCCTTKFFANNIDALAKEHRVITFDPRGQGKSSKGLQGHTVKRNCEDIKELLDYLDVSDVTMLGWSMAGQYIVKYFDMFNNYRIKALGLIDCPLGAAYDEDWNAHGLKGFNMELFNKKMAEYVDMDVDDVMSFETATGTSTFISKNLCAKIFSAKEVPINVMNNTKDNANFFILSPP